MNDIAYLKGYGRLKSLLLAQGVSPKLARSFSSFVEKLVNTRGPKGALLYLDSLGEAISEYVFGKSRSSQPSVWVRKKHIHNFRRVGKTSLLQKMTKIKRHIKVDRVTPAQAEKFLSAIRRDHAEAGPLYSAGQYVRRGVASMRPFFRNDTNWHPERAHMLYIKRELKRGRPLSEAFRKAFDKLCGDFRVVKRLGWEDYSLTKNIFYSSMSPLNRYEVDHVTDLASDAESDTFVGSIHGTQEPGMKLRVYASPLPLFQAALEPLKRFTMDVLHKLPQDGCFKVASVVNKVQGWLSEGRMLWSYDLSNATDTWPLSLLMTALNETGMVPEEQRLLFSLISKGTWKVSDDLIDQFKCDRVTWNVGQPLGTGPSFGAFSLAHHALVRGLCESLGKQEDVYVILGDDIVIADFEVAHAYKGILEALNINISQEKSIISDRFAEFAGFTITRTNYFRPGKWREVTGESLFTFVMDPDYDYKAVVPKYWVPLIERMRETPYPFGLDIPDVYNLSYEESSQLCKDIIGLFARAVASKEASSRLWTDDEISRQFYIETGLVDRIYPLTPIEETDDSVPKSLLARLFGRGRQTGRGRAVDGNRVLFLQRCCYSDPPERSSWLIKPGTSCLLYNGIQLDQITIPDSRKTPSSQDSDAGSGVIRENAADHLSGVPGQVFSAVGGLAHLIHSLLTSFSRVKVKEQYSMDALVGIWIQSVPLLEDIYRTSIEEPHPIQIVRDLIGNFPFYGEEDFSLIPAKFTSLLRRYARAKDVMPPTRSPLPKRVRRQS